MSHNFTNNRFSQTKNAWMGFLYSPIYNDYHGAFIVQRDKPISIVFRKPDELSDHHTLGLYTVRLFQDTHVTQCIVPQYHLM